VKRKIQIGVGLLLCIQVCFAFGESSIWTDPQAIPNTEPSVDHSILDQFIADQKARDEAELQQWYKDAVGEVSVGRAQEHLRNEMPLTQSAERLAAHPSLNQVGTALPEMECSVNDPECAATVIDNSIDMPIERPTISPANPQTPGFRQVNGKYIRVDN
jgi:hypothetical protein